MAVAAVMAGFGVVVLTAPRNKLGDLAVVCVSSGDFVGDAAVVSLRGCGDEAIQDPGGGREGGGGDGFGVQARHAVIASIGDALRACQATAAGFPVEIKDPADSW